MLAKADYIFLYILYIILAIIIAIREVKRLKKNKKLSAMNFFMFFFLIIYCIVPISCLKTISEGNNLKYGYNDYFYEHYISYIFTIISYICVNIGYGILKNKQDYKKEIIDSKSTSFLVSSIIIVILGWISLILFTKAYGSIFGMFEYAAKVRDGIVVVNNPYTFLNPICSFLLLATYNFVIILINAKDKGSVFKFLIVMLLILSIFGSIVYLMSDDSRTKMLIYFLVIMLCVFHKKIQNINYKSLILLVIAFIIVMFLITNLDTINNFIRKNKTEMEIKTSLNISEILVKEYSHIYTNSLNLINWKNTGKIVENRAFENAKALSVAFFPKRIKQKLNVTDMGDYNTSFYSNATGEIPTDLITASIYTWGYPGILITTTFIGIVLKIIDRTFERYKELNGYYRILFYIFACKETLYFIVYYDLSVLIYNLSDLIITYILIRTMNSIFTKNK